MGLATWKASCKRKTTIAFVNIQAHHTFTFCFRGQRLAEQMRESNPELVEQLRRQMDGSGGSDGNPDGSNRPDGGSSN